jgi:hypothetical protein
MFDDGAQRDRDLGLGLSLSPLIASGLSSVGYNTEANIANGFVDPEHKRFVFGSLEPMDVLRAALDAMQMFYGVPNSHDATDQNVFGTDTGEMWRDAASGRLVVSTPQFQALCGNLNGVGRVMAPGLRVRNLKTGTLVAISLDGKPLVSSRRFVIKLVTDARNVDEVSGRDVRFVNNPLGQWKIDVLGEGPVTTFGRASAAPIQIALENRPLVDVYLERGSFELMVDGDNWQFYCDTPGIRFALHHGAGRNELMTARAGSDDKVAAKTTVLQQVTLNGVVHTLSRVKGDRVTVAQFPKQTAVVRATG